MTKPTLIELVLGGLAQVKESDPRMAGEMGQMATLVRRTYAASHGKCYKANAAGGVQYAWDIDVPSKPMTLPNGHVFTLGQLFKDMFQVAYDCAQDVNWGHVNVIVKEDGKRYGISSIGDTKQDAMAIQQWELQLYQLKMRLRDEDPDRALASWSKGVEDEHLLLLGDCLKSLAQYDGLLHVYAEEAHEPDCLRIDLWLPYKSLHPPRKPTKLFDYNSGDAPAPVPGQPSKGKNYERTFEEPPAPLPE